MLDLNSLSADQLRAAARVFLGVVDNMIHGKNITDNEIVNGLKASQALRKVSNMQAFNLCIGEKLETLISMRVSGGYGVFCGEFYTYLAGQGGRPSLINESWPGDGATIFTCMVEGVPYRIARLCGQHPSEVWGYVENDQTGNRVLLEDEWSLARLKEI